MGTVRNAMPEITRWGICAFKDIWQVSEKAKPPCVRRSLEYAEFCDSKNVKGLAYQIYSRSYMNPAKKRKACQVVKVWYILSNINQNQKTEWHKSEKPSLHHANERVGSHVIL